MKYVKWKMSDNMKYHTATLGLVHQGNGKFIFKGHEIDLSASDDEPVAILKNVTNQLAEQLTTLHTDGIEKLFGKN